MPSHCEIAGNEKADLAAKRALNNPIYPMNVPYLDKYPLIRKFLNNKWQGQWDQDPTNKLYRIKPEIGAPLIVNSSRKDQVVINRIRLGHTFLTHSYLMETNSLKPKCHFCNLNCLLTVEHILIHCTYFSVIRSNYYSAQSMKTLFDSVDVMKILDFL